MLNLKSFPIVLLFIAAVAMPLSAGSVDSVTLESVSVSAGLTSAFGTTFAQLPIDPEHPGPFPLNPPPFPPEALLYSATICRDGDPDCPGGGGGGAGVELLKVRYTNIDISCDVVGGCDSFGTGFTFGGHLTGTAVFTFVLSDVVLTLGSGEYITGNISLELNVGGTYTNSFLSFDSRDGNTFGPTIPILISGTDVPYTAYGVFMVTSMPAGSRFQISNSGEFDFDSPTPEPALAWPVAAALAGLVLYRRRRAAL